jgi:hypothetical protein
MFYIPKSARAATVPNDPRIVAPRDSFAADFAPRGLRDTFTGNQFYTL